MLGGSGRQDFHFTSNWHPFFLLRFMCIVCIIHTFNIKHLKHIILILILIVNMFLIKKAGISPAFLNVLRVILCIRSSNTLSVLFSIRSGDSKGKRFSLIPGVPARAILPFVRLLLPLPFFFF